MINVAMERELSLIVPVHVPFGFWLRPYRDGDEAAWTELQGANHFGQPAPFEREFPNKPNERQWYVIHDGRPVATGTAWFPQPYKTAEWSMLHWVAVDPAYQRRGLGTLLCRHLLNMMIQFSHRSAFLITQSENLPAILCYLKLGFTPWIRGQDEELFWSSFAAPVIDRGGYGVQKSPSLASVSRARPNAADRKNEQGERSA